jgi:peptidoglycan/LPS O-acetylase OafA/YrhL
MSATTAQDLQGGVPPPARELYFPRFDWLRAACACVVMWYHGHIFTWERSGNFAVQIFFALSGWLIGGILLSTAPRDLPRFYFNRAVRIWAPYYLAAALLLALSALREPITSKWVEIVIYKLTFVYNLFGVPQLAHFQDAMPQKGTLSHFWSVNVEEQFYLAAPLCLVLLTHRLGRSPVLWGLLAVLGLATGLGAITLGVWAATLAHRHHDLHHRPMARAALAAGLAVCAVLLATDVDYPHVAPFAGLFIVLLLAVPGRRSRLGTLVGGMSYPLYLNHWAGIFVANYVLARVVHGTAPIAVAAVAQAAVDVPLAIALYWLVDRRLLAVRRSWYTPLRGATATVLAYVLLGVGVTYGLSMRAISAGPEHRATAPRNHSVEPL